MTRKTPCKRAILVISFGTSYHETCEKNIGAIEREIATAFPDWQVRRAFTSGMIIRKLKKRDNLDVDTVQSALEKLAEEGFETVFCQPTHILNGEEYDGIVQAVSPYFERFSCLQIGKPLLSSTEDYQMLVSVLAETYPLSSDTALCLMGHGSASHFADSAYAALDYHFKAQGHSNIFVGTVEGYPDLETMMQQVQRSDCKKVMLAPFMIVAGDHAINDMAGEEDDSWKRVFEAAGYPVSVVLKGLGESPAVRTMYVERVRKAVAVTDCNT